jgi:uncharacterized protein YegP (UPF0339 family)
MKHVVRGLVLPLVLVVAFIAVGHDPVGGGDKKTKDGKAAAATFELYKDKGGKFRFRLMDDDGTELAMSAHGYETKTECQKVIEAIKGAAAKAKIDDQAK